MSGRELNPPVRKLSPVFNDSRVSGVRQLIEDLAGLLPSRFYRQCEYCRLRTRHPIHEQTALESTPIILRLLISDAMSSVRRC
jgi:hypothetical protein